MKNPNKVQKGEKMTLMRKRVKVTKTFSLDPELLERVENLASKHQVSTSAAVEQLLRKALPPLPVLKG